MSERFIRCTQCGYPHVATAVVCPVTRQPIRASAESRPKPNAWAEPARRAAPVATASSTEVAGTSRDDAFIGQVVGGKYQIRGFLGHGGMGTVFEAVHIGIGRQTAIKVLHTSQLRKRDAVRRFHQEARSAARIGHPNICEVYDLGTLDDGRPFLVMERLVGETVADAIARDGGMSFVEVVDMMKQVLSGLYAAHEKGIIHRDIKPENVFLSRRVGCPPVAKLLDFGVSKMMTHHPQSKDDGDFEMTRTGIVLGTPYYLAPEQARGDRNLDARVDLYACGVLLYEALTGRRPFVAANYNALLIQILTGSPRPIRELRRDVPEDLARIVEKAMSRERHQRYHTAIDFQSDLPQYDARPSPPSRAPVSAPASVRAPASVPRPAPRPQSAPEPQLRATRVGAPVPSVRSERAPSGRTERAPSARPERVAASLAAEAIRSQAPRGLLDALPVATLFLPTAEPSPVVPSHAVAEDAGFAQAMGLRPARARLSSSEEIDALIGAGAPLSTPQGRPGRARKKIQHGFDEQPTEVNLPPSDLLDDESTAQLDADDVARISEEAERLDAEAAQKRKPTLLARRGIEFPDDGETELMTPDLRSRMREVFQGTRGPSAGAPTHSRSRKR